MNVHNITSAGKDATPEEKLLAHLNKYSDFYLGASLGLVMGAIIWKGKKVKVDKAAIVFEWMQEQVNAGKSVYALTYPQREMYEAVHTYADALAKRSGSTIESILHDIGMDYKAYFKHMDVYDSMH